jgi:hypothetical protein
VRDFEYPFAQIADVPFQGRHHPDWKLLSEMREHVRDVLRRDGEDWCGACGQKIFYYRRPLNQAMAKTLVRLILAGGLEEYVHAAGLRGDNHEVSQLVWWSLVVPDPAKREDGGKRGAYGVTEKGLAWYEDRIKIPSHARVFNAHCFGLTGDLIAMDETLPFNYRELMRRGEEE